MEKAKQIISKLKALTEEENREAIKLLFSELRYILRHARFRKINGELHIAMDNPYKMGRMLSILSMLYPVYAKNIDVYPSFDHNEIEGELHLKGHVRLIHLVRAAIHLLKNKEIRKLLLEGRD